MRINKIEIGLRRVGGSSTLRANERSSALRVGQSRTGSGHSRRYTEQLLYREVAGVT